MDELSIITFLLSILVTFLTFSVTMKKNNEYNEKEVKKYKKDLMPLFDITNNSVIKTNDTLDKTIKINDTLGKTIKINSKKLMENNLLEIKEYYVMSKTFANISFLLAVVSCVVGIVCIIISVIAFVFMKQLNYLPIISAALLETISATSLYVFKNTQKNLHAYFNALHENEQFLTIIDLVNNLSSEEIRDKAYLDIINNKLIKK
ncbi:hypothetical protein DWZ84_11100 [Coprobacillus sp. AF35-8]|jgi:hypothetical protein|uniref:TRADD-N-associated membrane domain-containing protein n=1 Tax=Faecalibacillus intestinalis TaxID=1982626 RepID=UPI000509EB2B|nr:hypothetical protein DWZ84_11100 [Coprobacillus sp. AF35-8]RHR14262.1 hypothetical protein DWX48_11330 [Coprobacillus sp. AF19-3]